MIVYNCSLIKTRLRITKTSSRMKGSVWIPKALLNFQQIVAVEENFLIIYFCCSLFVCFSFFVCFCFLFLLLAILDISQDKHPSGFISFGDMDGQRSRPICEASWRRFEKLRKPPFKQSCWHQIRQYPFIKVRKLV